MKKNTFIFTIAIIALLCGYLIGAFVGIPGVATSKTSGDINSVNTYNELLVSPGNMAFASKALSKDKEAQERTVSTLEIICKRIDAFNSMAYFAASQQSEENDLKFAITQLTDEAQKDMQARGAAHKALEAAKALENGEKVDLDEALQNAKVAYRTMESEIKVGKEYVQAVDSYLKGKDVHKNLMLATIRDLIASHCAVNASLSQNDAEMDYWFNVNGLVDENEMGLTMAQ